MTHTPLTASAETQPTETNVDARIQRQRTLKEGVISYNEGHISTKCTVRDLSPGGAKLRLPNDIAWPNRFRLHIASDGITAECEIRWRDGLTFGIEFIGELRMDAGQSRQMNVTVPVARPSLLRRK
ncbi:PilZ domain-containing protein [Ahrensia sp. R2A130]|uniref:PilZ domain-containing protein n=1 Tax=Ahrensia sp. R2A130 TaxID=744979 RepID=UPI0006833A57|nr:PilZ domain-containing protein [Ahrensia sp. R2A130]